MKDEYYKHIKLVCDALFLALHMIVPFLKLVTKFGYLDLYLFTYSLEDSTPDLGYPIYKPGRDCPDLIFLSSCDFFHRVTTGFYLSGLLYTSTTIFLLATLSTSLIPSKLQCLQSGLFDLFYPFSNLLSFSVLIFYSKTFESEILGVQGHFETHYRLGGCLLWINLILSLTSSYLSSKPVTSQSSDKLI